jgi:phytoene dehydrogenase-like protein
MLSWLAVGFHLYAARLLTATGADVLVLEAQANVGGRTLTGHFGDGTFVDDNQPHAIVSALDANAKTVRLDFVKPLWPGGNLVPTGGKREGPLLLGRRTALKLDSILRRQFD